MGQSCFHTQYCRYRYLSSHPYTTRMDLRNQDDFNVFMSRAMESNNNDCYIELYNVLLRSFVAADVDLDGIVSVDEFDGMIEAAAALPRKFGYKWWDEDRCPDEAARKKVREEMFKKIDENNDGGVSFDEWLNFALTQYKDICATALPKAFDMLDKDEFVNTVKGAADTSSPQYKLRTVYWFHWKCFQAADADRDGQVSEDEFDKMVDIATSAQKRLGLPTPFSTSEERKEMFAKMDENGDGSISFDEWLNFSLTQIFSQV